MPNPPARTSSLERRRGRRERGREEGEEGEDDGKDDVDGAEAIRDTEASNRQVFLYFKTL